MGGVAAADVFGHPPDVFPFPNNADLNFLVGKEVGQIALDPWSIQFRFVDEWQITVQGAFEHTSVDGVTHIHQDGERQDTGAIFIRDILQQKVARIEVERFRLTLFFENLAVLSFLSDEGPHECGQIYHPGFLSDGIIF